MGDVYYLYLRYKPIVFLCTTKWNTATARLARVNDHRMPLWLSYSQGGDTDLLLETVQQ